MRTDTIASAHIKGWLDQNGPKNDDKPVFRLVWSDDEFEIRSGLVAHYAGPIKIAEGEEVCRFPKYGYLRSRWVLEWFVQGSNDELPLTRQDGGSYEPIYVFEDKFGRPLELSLLVVQLIINVMTRPQSSSAEIRTRLLAEMMDKEHALDRYTEDSIDTNAMLSQLHHKEAGLVPKEHWVESVNLRKNND